MDCPVCGHPSAVFVDRAHQPAVFGHLQARAAAPLFFVCAQCQTVYSPAEFIEKVSEIIEAERERHAAWLEMIALLR